MKRTNLTRFLGGLLCLLLAFSSQLSYAQDAGETPPKVLNLTEVYKGMKYPKAAYEAKIEGKVFVKILVDQRGKYVKHEFLGNPHELLSQAVEDQLDQVKFSAGEKDGQKVSAWVTLPILFKIPE
ncbi:MAG: energy transducer TonB [Bacteroidota bacterium]